MITSDSVLTTDESCCLSQEAVRKVIQQTLQVAHTAHDVLQDQVVSVLPTATHKAGMVSGCKLTARSVILTTGMLHDQSKLCQFACKLLLSQLYCITYVYGLLPGRHADTL